MVHQRRTGQSVEDLAKFNCLIGNAASWHFDVGGVGRLFQPKGRWHCNSGEAVLEAALMGLGICQLPEFYVLPVLATGALEPLLENCQPKDEPIWAAYPQRRHLLPKVRELVERLRAELGPALGVLN